MVLPTNVRRVKGGSRSSAALLSSGPGDAAGEGRSGGQPRSPARHPVRLFAADICDPACTRRTIYPDPLRADCIANYGVGMQDPGDDDTGALIELAEQMEEQRIRPVNAVGEHQVAEIT